MVTYFDNVIQHNRLGIRPAKHVHYTIGTQPIKIYIYIHITNQYYLNNYKSNPI